MPCHSVVCIDLRISLHARIRQILGWEKDVESHVRRQLYVANCTAIHSVRLLYSGAV
jgi:hypothetical protein